MTQGFRPAILTTGKIQLAKIHEQKYIHRHTKIHYNTPQAYTPGIQEKYKRLNTDIYKKISLSPGVYSLSLSL